MTTEQIVDAQESVPTTVAIAPHDPKQLAKAKDMLEAANTYVIDCDEILDCAAEDLKNIKALAKDLDTKRKSITKPLDDAKKAVMELFKPAENYLTQAESILKKSIDRYVTQRDQQRRIALAAAEKAAREQQLALEQQAQEAEKTGDVEKAAELQLQAAITTVAAPVIETSKPKGISMRQVWKGDVTDPKALIAHILADETLFNLGIIKIDEGALNKLINSSEGKTVLPGVSNRSENIVAARAA